MLILGLFLSSCAVTPKKFSEYTQGEWTGKALVRNKETDKRGIVNLKIKAIDGDKLRLDITSTIGTHIASLLLDGQSLQYFIVAEKKYVASKADKSALKDILMVPIEPQYLYNVLFDKPFLEKTWNCTSDEKGFMSTCQEKKSGIKIQWVLREGARRTVNIEHATASVQFNLFGFISDISNPDKAFVLNAPPAFRVINR